MAYNPNDNALNLNYPLRVNVPNPKAEDDFNEQVRLTAVVSQPGMFGHLHNREEVQVFDAFGNPLPGVVINPPTHF